MAMTTTSTAATTAWNKTYYDRKLLAHAKTKFVHQQFGQKRSIPKNSGKIVEFRRYTLFTVNTTTLALTEGTKPSAQTMAQTTITATVAQYGAYVEISDLLTLTAIDPIVKDAVELLGEQLGTCIDWVTRDAMVAGASAQYAGGAASKATVAATSVLSLTEARKAVRSLKNAKAPQFADGGYVCIISPSQAYDLQSDTMWKDIAIHVDPKRAYTGEIGRCLGVTFVESTESKVEEDAGASSADLHHALIFGRDAYGVIDVEGSGAIKSYIKPAGSAGTADPIDQVSTVGAKVLAYTAKVLNSTWIIDLVTGVSA